jgi:nucleoside transporter
MQFRGKKYSSFSTKPKKETSFATKFQLGTMMFLQYLFFAVWWVQLAAYLSNLNVEPGQKALILSSMAIGTLFSPWVGMIADRYFASNWVLTALNAGTATLLFLAASTTEPTLLFYYLLGAMICYMPTWSLTSSIAMSHVSRESFPRIRTFGSLGWVSSALFSIIAAAMGVVQFDGTSLPLYCGAFTAVAATLVGFTLPHTKPSKKNKKASLADRLGLGALQLLQEGSFASFIALSFLAMIPFSVYWSYCSEFLRDQGFQYITATMNLGQVVEIGTLLLVPYLIKKVKLKGTMLIGLAALLIRYVSFYAGGSFSVEAFYFAAILVHGVIFGCFFVGGQVFIDKKAGGGLRNQAQGFLFQMTWGLGLLLGNWVSAQLIGLFSSPDASGKMVYDWNSIWGLTALVSGVVFVGFAALFHEGQKKKKPTSA